MSEGTPGSVCGLKPGAYERVFEHLVRGDLDAEDRDTLLYLMGVVRGQEIQILDLKMKVRALEMVLDSVVKKGQVQV